MTSCELPAIHVTSPADLIEAVPYLLGFHASQSVVLIGFRSGRPTASQHVTVSARADLDGFDETCTPALIEVLHGSGADGVAAVIFSDEVCGDPRDDARLQGVLATLTASLMGQPVELLDLLVATSSRWWSMCCRQVECCPAAGNVRAGPGSAVAAEATFAGLVALPDRRSMVAVLEGDPDASRATLRGPLQRADRRFNELVGRTGLIRTQRAEAAALMAAAADCEAGAVLGTRRLARLGAALTDIEVRDALWLSIDDQSVPARQLLVQLYRRLPAPYVVAPLFLFGWLEWRSGNGTLAAIAAERALDSEPSYSAARLLLEAVQRGLDPRSTPPLRNAGPGR